MSMNLFQVNPVYLNYLFDITLDDYKKYTLAATVRFTQIIQLSCLIAIAHNFQRSLPIFFMANNNKFTNADNLTNIDQNS